MSQKQTLVFGMRRHPKLHLYEYQQNTYPDFVVCDITDISESGRSDEHPFIIFDAKFKQE